MIMTKNIIEYLSNDIVNIIKKSKFDFYVVGGAVRDILLGVIPKDIDICCVGATENDILQEFPGALKTGKDFPVFRFSDYEIALARTERKTGNGYNGFHVDTNKITINDDLMRRDLTINSYAINIKTNELIKPAVYNGSNDISNRLLRHTSSAFSEDPLRVLRLARFAATYTDFTVDVNTIQLCKNIVKSGELNYLQPDRVYTEVEKVFTLAKIPSKFFNTLYDCEALEIVFPELFNTLGIPAGGSFGHYGEDVFQHTMDVLDGCVGHLPSTLWAAICHDLGKINTEPIKWPKHYDHDNDLNLSLVESLSKRIRVPNDWLNAGKLTLKYHMLAHRLHELKPITYYKMFSVIDKFPGGISEFFTVCKADGMNGNTELPYINMWKEVKAIKLPENKQNLGKTSGDYLLALRLSKIKEIKYRIKHSNIESNIEFK